MRLKRLTIHGFKSFAERTEFEFDAPLIGVIGPNGCGKSNIVDALKWVLGDQRPTSQRSREMTEVIFKGAEGREAMGFAEVRLTLEWDGAAPAGDGYGAGGDGAGGDGAGGDGAGGNGAGGDGAGGNGAGGNGDGAPHGGGEDHAVLLPGPSPESAAHAAVAGRAEVSVGRRLYRDGRSEYLLNDAVVRLKDVRDLLLDTGLGVGAYSVMEQGRIDAVLSANPEDRRSIFEEAAGISRFKFHRRECLRRLERTEANLARVRDLLEERGRRLRSLKAQASRARTWRELREKARNLRVALALETRRTWRAEMEEVEARLGDLLRREEALSSVRQERKAAAAERARARSERAAALQDLRDRLAALESEERSAAERIAFLQGRARDLDADREEALRREAEAAALRETAQREAGTLSERSAELEAERERLTSRAAAHRAAAREAGRRLKGLQEEREALRGGLLELLHQRTAHRNRATEQEIALRGACERIDRLLPRLEEVEAEAARVRVAREDLTRNLEDLARRRRALEEDLSSVAAGRARHQEAVARIQRLEGERREGLSALVSRLDVLRDLERSLEGMDQAPRRLLEEGAADPQGAARGCLGRLVDRFSCDVAHAGALEAALGGRVQALLVEDRAAAQRLLEEVAARGWGGIQMVLAGAAAGAPAAREAPPPPAVPGVLGWLRDMVRCAPEDEALADRLLEGVLLVESLQCVPAVLEALAPDGIGAPGTPSRWFCATPQGAFAQGDLVVGAVAPDAAAGLVQRRSALAELEGLLEVRQQELEELRRTAAHEEGALGRLLERERSLAASREEARLQAADAGARLAAMDARLADQEREAQVLAAEAALQRRARLGSLALLGRELCNVALLRRRERRVEERIRALSEAVEQSAAQAAQAQREDQEAHVQLAARTSEREGVLQSLEVARRALAEQEALLARLRQDAEALHARRREAEGEAEAAAARRRQVAAARERHAAELAREEEQLQEQDRREAVLAEEAEDLERQAAALKEERAEVRLARQELEHRMLREEERIREDFSVELRRVAGEVSREAPGDLHGPPLSPGWYREEEGSVAFLQTLEGPPDVEAFRREAEAAEARLARLGPVNPSAIEELEAEEEQLSFLARQEADLSEGRRSLMETIKRINAESRSLFEATFEEARRNFQAIFRKLFQGGRADIRLLEGDDPLEAGIEITARPPGKELQSINLLSGGERSLTALALLLGIFKVKPSPFCVLDEVDAALDDTNVDRFLRVLGEFVGPTQFLVVTHHKRTMLACPVLYGITMQKKGVSTRLSVRLEDVESGRASAFVGGDREALAASRLPRGAAPASPPPPPRAPGS